jgi:pilus assembly protein Flp/PilA
MADFPAAENRTSLFGGEKSRFPTVFDRTKFLARSENMTSMMKRLWKEEQGQDLTEYALLVVLIALVAIASVSTLGASISDVFANATTNITT